jgi:hypothetical protein
VAAKRTTGAELAKNKQILRSMYFHPENFLDAEMRCDAKVSSLEEMKKKMLALHLPRGQRLEQHREIESVNAELRGYLQEKTEKQKNLLTDLQQAAAATEFWSSREWSFCLFSECFLKRRLLDLKFTDR